MTPREWAYAIVLAHRLEDRQETREVLRQLFALRQQLGQGLALNELHREERPPIGYLSTVVYRGDAGMLQLAVDLPFFQETSRQGGRVAPMPVQHVTLTASTRLNS